MSSGRAVPPTGPPPTSSGQEVLMKDQTRIKRAIRKTTIIVNSRDRNLLGYPNSNNFRYIFKRPLTNVSSIELIDGSIPIRLYTINTGWNKFTFREGTTNYNITIPVGFYNEETLRAQLEALLNAISGSGYTVTLSALTGKLTIVSSKGSAFAFLFYSGDFHDDIDLNTRAVTSINTPARQLGFGLNDYTSDSAFTITAPLPMDLNNFLNRIYIHVNANNNQDLHRMEVSNGRIDCFHVVFIDPRIPNTTPTPGSTDLTPDYYYLDKETNFPLFESSPAPMARLATLEFSFRDEFYRLVDFQHREVNLVFEITHLE